MTIKITIPNDGPTGDKPKKSISTGNTNQYQPKVPPAVIQKKTGIGDMLKKLHSKEKPLQNIVKPDEVK